MAKSGDASIIKTLADSTHLLITNIRQVYYCVMIPLELKGSVGKADDGPASAGNPEPGDAGVGVCTVVPEPGDACGGVCTGAPEPRRGEIGGVCAGDPEAGDAGGGVCTGAPEPRDACGGVCTGAPEPGDAGGGVCTGAPEPGDAGGGVCAGGLEPKDASQETTRCIIGTRAMVAGAGLFVKYHPVWTRTIVARVASTANMMGLRAEGASNGGASKGTATVSP